MIGMGKVDDQPLPVVQQLPGGRRCSVDVFKFISFKCVAILVFGVAAFVFALFWALPVRYWRLGFDAKDSVKQSAPVQAYFRLNKPVFELLPYVKKLEYDLNGELGVPFTKVAVLSMHQETKSNWTDVVFGFLPDPMNSTMDPVPLSYLKLTLIDVYLKQYNLTVDHPLFGDPSSFEILKFPGGITLIPEQAALIFQIHPVLFNFTLNSSICEITENLQDLKKQLKSGLHLMPNEAVYITVTNKNGSTVNSPVSVEASIVSELGHLSWERLKQLARILTGPAKNLGLDNYVFGKVKGIRLSSYLKHSLHAPTPTPSPSPAPSPDSTHGCGPSSPPSSPSPQNKPSFPFPPRAHPPKHPVHHDSPYHGCLNPPIASPVPHSDHIPPTISPASSESPLSGSTPQILPSPSPLPSPVYGSQGQGKKSRKRLVSPPRLLSSLSSSSSSGTPRIQWLNLIGSFTVLLFCVS